MLHIALQRCLVHSFSGDEKLPHHMEFKLKVAYGRWARMRMRKRVLGV